MRLPRHLGSRVLLVLGSSWFVLAVLLSGLSPQSERLGRYAVALLGVAAVGLAWRLRSRALALGVLAVLCVGAFAWLHSFQPSLTRDWSPDLARLAHADVEGSRVTLHDMRNFHYRNTHDWDEAWYSATYDTRDLVRGWFIIEPFSKLEGLAHTMVSFEFTQDRFVTLSVEIRREKGESYSPLGGLFRQYEIVYVAGDERDLIQLRSNHRRDDVYLYPIRASHERTAAFFMDMVQRLNTLHDHPEYYNALTSNCTTNLVRHLEKVSAMAVPYDYRTLLPGYSDELAYSLGLIDTDVGLAETRERHRINELALAAQDREDFSLRIRGRAPAPPALQVESTGP